MQRFSMRVLSVAPLHQHLPSTFLPNSVFGFKPDWCSPFVRDLETELYCEDLGDETILVVCGEEGRHLSGTGRGDDVATDTLDVADW